MAGSQRGIITAVAPRNIGMFMPFCRPSMWKSGATASVTVSTCSCFHTAEEASEASIVAWVCMQPLGWPVVPEV